MGKRFKSGKSKRESGAFLALPVSVLHSQAYAGLSPYAAKLLLDIGSQYRGDNNGDLSAAWKLMKPKGWRSEATLNKAKRELLQAGFIVETRIGRRPNLCTLYALTWLALDPCDKHEMTPAGFKFGAWRMNEPVPPLCPRPKYRSGNGA